jgi:hypothetical protein
MNAVAAHKEHLEKLLEDLSSESVVSGITFVALVNAYITRLDMNGSELNAHVTPPPAHTDRELTYGTNIDSKLRPLLRATESFKTARRVFPEISRCGPQTSTGRLPAAATWQTARAPNSLPGQRTLIDAKQEIKHEDVKETKSEFRSSSQNRSAPDDLSGKPKYLFRGMVK